MHVQSLTRTPRELEHLEVISLWSIYPDAEPRKKLTAAEQSQPAPLPRLERRSPLTERVLEVMHEPLTKAEIAARAKLSVTQAENAIHRLVTAQQVRRSRGADVGAIRAGDTESAEGAARSGSGMTCLVGYCVAMAESPSEFCAVHRHLPAEIVLALRKCMAGMVAPLEPVTTRIEYEQKERVR